MKIPEMDNKKRNASEMEESENDSSSENKHFKNDSCCQDVAGVKQKPVEAVKPYPSKENLKLDIKKRTFNYSNENLRCVFCDAVGERLYCTCVMCSECFFKKFDEKISGVSISSCPKCHKIQRGLVYLDGSVSDLTFGPLLNLSWDDLVELQFEACLKEKANLWKFENDVNPDFKSVFVDAFIDLAMLIMYNKSARNSYVHNIGTEKPLNLVFVDIFSLILRNPEEKQQGQSVHENIAFNMIMSFLMLPSDVSHEDYLVSVQRKKFIFKSKELKTKLMKLWW